MGRKSLAKERRGQIVKALNRCISKYGLQNTTIKKIAEEAGVQPGILHHYFKDRDEIVEEMVRTIVDEVAGKYLEEVRRKRSPETRFEKGIRFLFSPEMIGDEYADFFSDCWAESKRNPRIRDSFRMLYGRFRKAIVELLRQNEEFAKLPPAEMKQLATMIVAIQDGISLQWNITPESISLAAAAKMTKQMIDLYISGRIAANKRTGAAVRSRNPIPE
jgi:AcrR family transcriptional regulator